MTVFLLSLCIVGAMAGTVAAEPLVLTDADGPFSVTQMETLQDTGGTLTLEHVVSGRFDSKFVQSPMRAAHHAWTRFAVSNESRDVHDWVVVTQLRTVEATLYVPNESGDGWIAQRGGDSVPVEQAPVRYRWPAHRLHVAPGETLEVYLFTELAGDEIVPMMIDVWSEAGFAEFHSFDRLLLGMYYGIVAVMVLYNLFVYLSLRDRVYLYYVLSAASMGLFFLGYNGIGREYLWASADYERQWVFLSGVAWVMALVFVREFLQTRTHAPRIDLVMRGVLVFQFLTSMSAMAGIHAILLSVLTPITMLQWTFLLVTGIVVWRQGFGPARFFLIAWGPYVTGGFLLCGVILGLLPRTYYTFNALQFSHAYEVVLLSLALADRINTLRREKEEEAAAAQAASLRARDLELQAQAAENELSKRERDQARAVLARERRRRLQPRPHTIDNWTLEDFVGDSAAMQSVYAQIQTLQKSDARVLITGEQGTGKELVARAIHAGSRRSQGAFAVLRCAELPTNLDDLDVRTRVLSELLGHVTGAFAGADSDRDGLLQQAKGGTLFLDEVGLLPLPLQNQLQRMLEQGHVRRTGATATERLDVRVMSSTSEDPQELEAAGFNQHFFGFLSEMRIAMPALRDRREDIGALAQQILQQYMADSGRQVAPLSDETLGLLKREAPPGNVRQLRQRLVAALSERGPQPLRPEDLSLAS